MSHLLARAERLKGCAWEEGLPERAHGPGYDIPYMEPPFGFDGAIFRNQKIYRAV